ncbi:hypothetical protein BGX26_012636 [Mortierella sp. AD094]|nr:hypothetical protein BGX26_012636 [Mortierella sp. AD094]
MSRKNANPASNHSYIPLSIRDPDESTISDNLHRGQTSEEIENSHPDQRRASMSGENSPSSFDMDPVESLRQRRHLSKIRDDCSFGDGPIVNSKHWGRYWVRYLAVACILAAVAILVPLLIIKPWHPRRWTAPLTNDNVKTMPDEQPVLPIPRSFSFGSEKVSLSPTFQIKVQSSSNNQPLDTTLYPVLNKAITRCMDRIQIKRNTTIIETNDYPNHSTQDATSLPELVIIIDNAQAVLEYGVNESYVINIANSQPGLPVQPKNESPKVHEELARLKRAPVGVASAVLKANTQFGVLNGLETFLQLILASSATPGSGTLVPGQPVENILEIPNVPWLIQDEPHYSHRGILLDTSRNYIHVKDILRTLDAMSIVKFNVFHWHVLDQQTYPLVSKAYPDLAAKGAERPDYIYSEQDVATIIQHGQELGIRVLPEFDSPGHAASWGRSYPNLTVCLDAQPHQKYAAEPPAGQLDPLEPFTYTVLDTLVKEWTAQFPDNQAHLGGDEVNFECWKTSDRLRDYIEHPDHCAQYESVLLPTPENAAPENSMRRTTSGRQSGEDKLLELYLNKAFGMFLAQGKRPIVWEEMALEHNVMLPDSAIVQVWKNAGNAKRVIDQGRPVILSSSDYWYLDCSSGQWLIGPQRDIWCSFSNWQRIYSYRLTDQLNDAQQKMVYGGEVCMWGEQTDSSNLDSSLWPRSAAAAEVLWSGSKDDQGNIRPLMHAAKRLAAVRDRLLQMGVAAAPMYPSWCRHHPEGCLA